MPSKSNMEYRENEAINCMRYNINNFAIDSNFFSMITLIRRVTPAIHSAQNA